MGVEGGERGVLEGVDVRGGGDVLEGVDVRGGVVVWGTLRG